MTAMRSKNLNIFSAKVVDFDEKYFFNPKSTPPAENFPMKCSKISHGMMVSLCQNADFNDTAGDPCDPMRRLIRGFDRVMGPG
jgi:hypothetical protein